MVLKHFLVRITMSYDLDQKIDNNIKYILILINININIKSYIPNYKISIVVSNIKIVTDAKLTINLK